MPREGDHLESSDGLGAEFRSTALAESQVLLWRLVNKSRHVQDAVEQVGIDQGFENEYDLKVAELVQEREHLDHLNNGVLFVLLLGHADVDANGTEN